jgi:phage-related holin
MIFFTLICQLLINDFSVVSQAITRIIVRTRMFLVIVVVLTELLLGNMEIKIHERTSFYIVNEKYLYVVTRCSVILI